MAAYRTKDGDMLDAICFRHYGTSTRTTELVLDANPGLADLGAVFVSGIEIVLPDVKPDPVSAPVRLWD